MALVRADRTVRGFGPQGPDLASDSLMARRRLRHDLALQRIEDAAAYFPWFSVGTTSGSLERGVGFGRSGSLERGVGFGKAGSLVCGAGSCGRDVLTGPCSRWERLARRPGTKGRRCRPEWSEVLERLP